MKALTKEHLIKAIKANFKKGEIIFEDDVTLNTIFQKLGDSYYIVDGEWQMTKKANVDWGDVDGNY